MKKESWVVAANSAHARIFKLDNIELRERQSLVHEQSRMHQKDLTCDKAGQARQGVGPATVAMEKPISPKKYEAVIFAKQVADFLDEARARGEIDKIYIAASPPFLGLLRQEMTQLTTALVAAEVGKDITQMTPKEIINYFPIGL